MQRKDRVVLRMYGRDPLKMIQGLATNDIAGAPVDTSVYTTFLTPKGKLIGDARVLRRADGDIWIEADGAAADNIAAMLKKTVPPLFARFELTAFRVFRGNPEKTAHLAVLTNPFRPDVVDLVVDGGTELRDEAALRDGGPDVRHADAEEAARIEAGEPVWGAELTEDVIPLEAGLKDVAISQSKGCYTGQEVIIRILHRGHVNRHLRGLLTGAADVPAAGTELVRDGKVVGRITSAAYSERFGQAIALAYVRREIAPGSPVRMGDREVTVVEVPFQ